MNYDENNYLINRIITLIVCSILFYNFLFENKIFAQEIDTNATSSIAIYANIHFNNNDILMGVSFFNHNVESTNISAAFSVYFRPYGKRILVKENDDSVGDKPKGPCRRFLF